MRCYRIVRKKYAAILSGEGARLYGGRWNTKGTSIIYTAETSSLAMLEMLVQRSVQLVGMEYYLITIEIPDALVSVPLSMRELPLAWDAYPPNASTKIIGDEFVNRGEDLLLAIPSVINELEHNILINDLHPNFKEVKLVSSKQIVFDKRLIADL